MISLYVLEKYVPPSLSIRNEKLYGFWHDLSRYISFSVRHDRSTLFHQPYYNGVTQLSMHVGHHKIN